MSSAASGRDRSTARTVAVIACARASSSARACSFPALRATRTTSRPPAAISRARSSPMPPDAPVTSRFLHAAIVDVCAWWKNADGRGSSDAAAFVQAVTRTWANSRDERRDRRRGVRPSSRCVLSHRDSLRCVLPTEFSPMPRVTLRRSLVPTSSARQPLAEAPQSHRLPRETSARQTGDFDGRPRRPVCAESAA